MTVPETPAMTEMTHLAAVVHAEMVSDSHGAS